MKRTPRSASRRASRQLAAKRAGLARIGAVELERARRLLRESVSSGTEDCIRNAISYCAMRVAISGIAELARRRPGSACRARRACGAASSRLKPGGSDRYSTGSPAGAELHALILRGQEAAAPQPVVERLIRSLPLPCEIITTNAGRSSVSLPRPYASHDAHAGPARQLDAGLNERDGRIVIDRFGVHRLDEADSSAIFGRVRQQFADPGAGLAVLRELEHRRHHRKARLRRTSCR